MKSLPVRSLVLATLAAVALVACNQQSAEEAAPAAAPSISETTQQRVADLVSINTALQQYHTTNGAYPVSNGAQGYVSAFGGSLGANWIPELGVALPRDPSGSEAGNEAQYLYISNGADYKLIAHATDDCSSAVETSGVRVDARRAEGDVCWGYGFWSPGGESF